MFKRIDHIEIVTDQLDRTVEFYTEVLHFTVKARDRIEQSSMGTPIDLVYLDLGGTVVELISYEGAKVEPAPQREHLGYRMIALEIDDMHSRKGIGEGDRKGTRSETHAALRQLTAADGTRKLLQRME